MKPRLSIVSALALWGLLAVPLPAGADAVPPPPEHCPKGQVPVTSHAGPQCLDPAPKNCPPGWRGQLGGTCALHTCQDDSWCGEGLVCREVDLCLQEFVVEWGYTQVEVPRPLFAGPPMHFDPPRHEIRPVGICLAERSCTAPAKCGKGKLCLPKGVTRPGVWPAPTKEPAKGPSKPPR